MGYEDGDTVSELGMEALRRASGSGVVPGSPVSAPTPPAPAPAVESAPVPAPAPAPVEAPSLQIEDTLRGTVPVQKQVAIDQAIKPYAVPDPIEGADIISAPGMEALRRAGSPHFRPQTQTQQVSSTGEIAPGETGPLLSTPWGEDITEQQLFERLQKWQEEGLAQGLILKDPYVDDQGQPIYEKAPPQVEGEQLYNTAWGDGWTKEQIDTRVDEEVEKAKGKGYLLVAPFFRGDGTPVYGLPEVIQNINAEGEEPEFWGPAGRIETETRNRAEKALVGDIPLSPKEWVEIEREFGLALMPEISTPKNQVDYRVAWLTDWAQRAIALDDSYRRKTFPRESEILDKIILDQPFEAGENAEAYNRQIADEFADRYVAAEGVRAANTLGRDWSYQLTTESREKSKQAYSAFHALNRTKWPHPLAGGHLGAVKTKSDLDIWTVGLEMENYYKRAEEVKEFMSYGHLDSTRTDETYMEWLRSVTPDWWDEHYMGMIPYNEENLERFLSPITPGSKPRLMIDPLGVSDYGDFNKFQKTYEGYESEYGKLIRKYHRDYLNTKILEHTANDTEPPERGLVRMYVGAKKAGKEDELLDYIQTWVDPTVKSFEHLFTVWSSETLSGTGRSATALSKRWDRLIVGAEKEWDQAQEEKRGSSPFPVPAPGSPEEATLQRFALPRRAAETGWRVVEGGPSIPGIGGTAFRKGIDASQYALDIWPEDLRLMAEKEKEAGNKEAAAIYESAATRLELAKSEGTSLLRIKKDVESELEELYWVQYQRTMSKNARRVGPIPPPPIHDKDYREVLIRRYGDTQSIPVVTWSAENERFEYLVGDKRMSASTLDPKFGRDWIGLPHSYLGKTPGSDPQKALADWVLATAGLPPIKQVPVTWDPRNIPDMKSGRGEAHTAGLVEFALNLPGHLNPFNNPDVSGRSSFVGGGLRGTGWADKSAQEFWGGLDTEETKAAKAEAWSMLSDEGRDQARANPEMLSSLIQEQSYEVQKRLESAPREGEFVERKTGLKARDIQIRFSPNGLASVNDLMMDLTEYHVHTYLEDDPTWLGYVKGQEQIIPGQENRWETIYGADWEKKKAAVYAVAENNAGIEIAKIMNSGSGLMWIDTDPEGTQNWLADLPYFQRWAGSILQPPSMMTFSSEAFGPMTPQKRKQLAKTSPHSPAYWDTRAGISEAATIDPFLNQQIDYRRTGTIDHLANLFPSEYYGALSLNNRMQLLQNPDQARGLSDFGTAPGYGSPERLMSGEAPWHEVILGSGPMGIGLGAWREAKLNWDRAVGKNLHGYRERRQFVQLLGGDTSSMAALGQSFEDLGRAWEMDNDSISNMRTTGQILGFGMMLIEPDPFSMAMTAFGSSARGFSKWRRGIETAPKDLRKIAKQVRDGKLTVKEANEILEKGKGSGGLGLPYEAKAALVEAGAQAKAHKGLVESLHDAVKEQDYAVKQARKAAKKAGFHDASPALLPGNQFRSENARDLWLAQRTRHYISEGQGRKTAKQSAMADLLDDMANLHKKADEFTEVGDIYKALQRDRKGNVIETYYVRTAAKTSEGVIEASWRPWVTRSVTEGEEFKYAGKETFTPHSFRDPINVAHDGRRMEIGSVYRGLGEATEAPLGAVKVNGAQIGEGGGLSPFLSETGGLEWRQVIRETAEDLTHKTARLGDEVFQPPREIIFGADPGRALAEPGLPYKLNIPEPGSPLNTRGWYRPDPGPPRSVAEVRRAAEGYHTAQAKVAHAQVQAAEAQLAHAEATYKQFKNQEGGLFRRYTSLKKKIEEWRTELRAANKKHEEAIEWALQAKADWEITGRQFARAERERVAAKEELRIVTSAEPQAVSKGDIKVEQLHREIYGARTAPQVKDPVLPKTGREALTDQLTNLQRRETRINKQLEAARKELYGILRGSPVSYDAVGASLKYRDAAARRTAETAARERLKAAVKESGSVKLQIRQKIEQILDEPHPRKAPDDGLVSDPRVGRIPPGKARQPGYDIGPEGIEEFWYSGFEWRVRKNALIASRERLKAAEQALVPHKQAFDLVNTNFKAANKNLAKAQGAVLKLENKLKGAEDALWGTETVVAGLQGTGRISDAQLLRLRQAYRNATSPAQKEIMLQKWHERMRVLAEEAAKKAPTTTPRASRFMPAWYHEEAGTMLSVMRDQFAFAKAQSKLAEKAYREKLKALKSYNRKVNPDRDAKLVRKAHKKKQQAREAMHRAQAYPAALERLAHDIDVGSKALKKSPGKGDKYVDLLGDSVVSRPTSVGYFRRSLRRMVSIASGKAAAEKKAAKWERASMRPVDEVENEIIAIDAKIKEKTDEASELAANIVDRFEQRLSPTLKEHFHSRLEGITDSDEAIEILEPLISKLPYGLSGLPLTNRSAAESYARYIAYKNEALSEASALTARKAELSDELKKVEALDEVPDLRQKDFVLDPTELHRFLTREWGAHTLKRATEEITHTGLTRGGTGTDILKRLLDDAKEGTVESRVSLEDMEELQDIHSALHRAWREGHKEARSISVFEGLKIARTDFHGSLNKFDRSTTWATKAAKKWSAKFNPAAHEIGEVSEDIQEIVRSVDHMADHVTSEMYNLTVALEKGWKETKKAQKSGKHPDNPYTHMNKEEYIMDGFFRYLDSNEAMRLDIAAPIIPVVLRPKLTRRTWMNVSDISMWQQMRHQILTDPRAVKGLDRVKAHGKTMQAAKKALKEVEELLAAPAPRPVPKMGEDLKDLAAPAAVPVKEKKWKKLIKTGDREMDEILIRQVDEWIRADKKYDLYDEYKITNARYEGNPFDMKGDRTSGIAWALTLFPVPHGESLNALQRGFMYREMMTLLKSDAGSSAQNFHKAMTELYSNPRVHRASKKKIEFGRYDKSRVNDTRSAAIMTMAVAHGAIQYRTNKMLSKATGGFFTTDEISIANKMLEMDPARINAVPGSAGRRAMEEGKKAAEKAHEKTARGNLTRTLAQTEKDAKALGVPEEFSQMHLGFNVLNAWERPYLQGVVRVGEAGKELKKFTDFISTGRDLGGRHYHQAKALADKLDRVLPPIIKELTPQAASLRDPTKSAIKQNLADFFSFWRASVVTGTLVPRPAYLMNNFFGDYSQLWMAHGFREANAQSLRFIMGVPWWSDRLVDWRQAMAKKFGVDIDDVLPDMTTSLFNPHINKIFRGDKGFIRIANTGQVKSNRSLLQSAIQRGILDTHVHEDVLRSFTQASVSQKLANGMPHTVFEKVFNTSWKRDISELASYAQQRQRFSFYATQIAEGYTESAAAKRTLEAFYDWKSGVAKAEIQAMAQYIPFYRFWRLAMRQTFLKLIEPLTKPSKEMMKKGLSGQTGLARLNQQLAFSKYLYDTIDPDLSEDHNDVALRYDLAARYYQPEWKGTRPTWDSGRLTLGRQAFYEQTRGMGGATHHFSTLGPFTALDTADLMNRWLTGISGALIESADIEFPDKSILRGALAEDWSDNVLVPTADLLFPHHKEWLLAGLGAMGALSTAQHRERVRANGLEYSMLTENPEYIKELKAESPFLGGVAEYANNIFMMGLQPGDLEEDEHGRATIPWHKAFFSRNVPVLLEVQGLLKHSIYENPDWYDSEGTYDFMAGIRFFGGRFSGIMQQHPFQAPIEATTSTQPMYGPGTNQSILEWSENHLFLDRERIPELLITGSIMVNGEGVDPSYIIKAGDRINYPYVAGEYGDSPTSLTDYEKDPGDDDIAIPTPRRGQKVKRREYIVGAHLQELDAKMDWDNPDRSGKTAGESQPSEIPIHTPAAPATPAGQPSSAGREALRRATSGVEE